jgi:hypothetical protein
MLDLFVRHLAGRPSGLKEAFGFTEREFAAVVSKAIDDGYFESGSAVPQERDNE